MELIHTKRGPDELGPGEQFVPLLKLTPAKMTSEVLTEKITSAMREPCVLRTVVVRGIDDGVYIRYSAIDGSIPDRASSS